MNDAKESSSPEAVGSALIVLDVAALCFLDGSDTAVHLHDRLGDIRLWKRHRRVAQTNQILIFCLFAAG